MLPKKIKVTPQNEINISKKKEHVAKILTELKEIFKRFFPEVGDSEHIILKFLWVTIYILSLTVFAMQFKPLIVKYLKYEATVSISIEHAKYLQFPQITICKENIFENSIIKSTTTHNLYQLGLLDKVQKEFVKMLSRRNEVPFDVSECLQEFVKCSIIDECIPNIWKCDGVVDCQDETDEKNCPPTAIRINSSCVGDKYLPCSDDTVKCALYCDEILDCRDGSDENNCINIQSNIIFNPTKEFQLIKSHHEFLKTNYPKNIQKTFTIIQLNEEYKYIELEFDYFELEEEKSEICNDYVEVHDANQKKPSNWEQAHVCGRDIPETTVLVAPVEIVFYSDFTEVDLGFEVKYRAVHSMSISRSKREITNLKDTEKDIEHKIISKTSEYDWKGMYSLLKSHSHLDYAVTSKFAKFEPKIPFWFGDSLRDLVISCKYGTKNCASFIGDVNNAEFDLLMNAQYGKCYIYNSNKRIIKFNESIKLSENSGYENGLSLVLFVDEDDQIGFLNRISGISVTLNAPVIYPLPSRNSILIKPGTVSRIHISQRMIRRLSQPHNPCSTTQPNWKLHNQLDSALKLQFINESDYNSLKSNGKFEDPHEIWPGYNQQTCIESCLYENQKRICGCVDSYLYVYFDFKGVPHSLFPICNPWNVSQFNCLDKIMETYRTSRPLPVPCDCPQACMDIVYDLKIASADFPSTNYLYYFIEELLESADTASKRYIREKLTMRALDKITQNEFMSDIKRNFIRLEIFFEELNYELINENVAYTFEELLSAFAGNIGMFVGWSVLTFSQLILFLFNSILSIFSK